MISTAAVGTDGSATAAEAAKMAAELARRFGASLVLVSASQGSDQAPIDRRAAPVEVQWAVSPLARLQEMLDRTQEDLRRDGIDCTTHVDEGDPPEVLVRLAAEGFRHGPAWVRTKDSRIKSPELYH